MGIWSEPLGTFCKNLDGSVIPGSQVVLEIKEDSPARRLESHATGVLGRTTFEASIMATCDTAKIYGYLCAAEFEAWEDYFTTLMEQNPNLGLAEAHFYCCDYGFPYFIRRERDNNHTSWHKVYRGNLACYTFQSQDEDPEELRLDLVFHKGSYMAMVRDHRDRLDMLHEEEISHVEWVVKKSMAQHFTESRKKPWLF